MDAPSNVSKVLTETSTPHLAERIHEEVSERTHGAVKGLRVSLEGAVIVISGDTTRFHVKQRATMAVFDLVPELDIENRIEVDSDRLRSRSLRLS